MNAGLRRDRVAIDLLRARHRSEVISRGWRYGWACSCGRESSNYDMTEGRARAGKDRHLKTALRHIVEGIG